MLTVLVVLQILTPSNEGCEQRSLQSIEEDCSIHSSLLFVNSTLTVLQALAHIFHWFTAHPATSKEAVSEMLSMQYNFLLPSGNLLPKSYYEAHHIIEPFLIKPEIFDACVNDCILYRKGYKDANFCPHCKCPRYKHGKVAARKFLYLPLRPRLVRMFNNKGFSEVLQSHPGASFVNASSSSESMYDIHDSPAWKQAYSETGMFKGDKRGISLALCTDGVNPFSHSRVKYSMWPIMMTILNLPRHLRSLFGSILLLGIIPGNGKQEPKNLDPYLEVVADELQELNMLNIYDAFQNTIFNLKIEILLYVMDYPGIGKVFKVSGSGAYKGCIWCDIKGMNRKKYKRHDLFINNYYYFFFNNF